MENVFKILRENVFQTKIPYPAKSSLKGEIKIKFLVMQGFSNLPPIWRTELYQKREQNKKDEDFGSRNKGSTKRRR
jgi:hypothetical protein